VLLVLGVVGASRVKLESSFLEIFKDSAQIKIETERIQDKLAGTVTLDVMIDTGTEGGIKEPVLLATLTDLEAHMESMEIVASAQSINASFKDMRRAFFNNDQNEYRLPATREEAAQYLLLYEMDAPDGDIREFTTYEYDKTRASARLALTTSAAATEVVEKTQVFLDNSLPPGVTARPAGLAVLYAHMEEYVRASLVRGFSIALLAIFIIFCIQMRSIRLGLIAMIPNFTPIIMCLGVMGYYGISLDSMTALVASVTIGLAVDDSIHFVSRVRSRLGDGVEMVEALRDATVEVGRALVYTSLTLSVGFGVLMLGSFVGMVYFGLLCVLTIVFALAADLLLLPVVLRWYDRTLTGPRSVPELFGAVREKDLGETA